MIVADYIANYLKKKKIENIFMLTGYGAMYLNDSIKKAKIRYYATRNEATAPIMAASYGRVKNDIGVACVTAGPGATNAIPGLAEAFVDSSPIVVISGQVEKKHTTISTNSKTIRTFGTAEINIEPIVKNLTKYSKTILDAQEVKYILDKAFHLSRSGRPGPVWIDVPLDIQRQDININTLKSFKPKKSKEKNNYSYFGKIIKSIKKSKKPIIVCGQGVKFSNTFGKIYNDICLKYNIPILFTRGAQDLTSHKKKLVLGQAGIKGTAYCKKIMTQCDLVINFGSRLAPQFIGHNFDAFNKAKIISVDIEKDELNKKGAKIGIKVNADLKIFIPKFLKELKKTKQLNFKNWGDYCDKLKLEKIKYTSYKKNPIDLYYFMSQLGNYSSKKHVLITDAGSNYYIGGQVWQFEKGQKEITSITNAAMGLSIPLAIGAAVADKNKQILAVTGDGSLELNIQELKTMSHYNLNVKLFVINNGGYVSMHNWADNFFEGRQVDNTKDTGEGTLHFKKVADAFDLLYYRISDFRETKKNLQEIMNNNKPMFIEVITNNKQVIFDAFKDKG